MKKHLILILVFEFLAIGMMIKAILNVVTDEKSAVTFVVGCVFAWFVKTNWEIFKKIKQIYKQA
ncbi:hypothetical protein [uncultured Phascolarctobacterium sp.]|uniref:hypothetical protein n=1 Tax=uncultured Phascolarctobacterium sp. TaxID=512296 RepID=UPI0025F98FAF|nr:hypothetical protein [uncultured Phascolarctobacterium sp.]